MTNTKWVSFRNREGPVVHGVHSYKLPDAPGERDVYVAAAVACEEGSYDDVNMYDRGIVSVGLFQWIEANYSTVSTLLGLVCDAGFSAHVQDCLRNVLRLCNAKFVKGTIKWHFVMDGEVVDTTDAQKRLFYGCNGTAGSWTPETRGRAILWAESLASIWDKPEVREVQRKFANDRVMQFVFKTSKAVLFGSSAPTTPYATAIKAVYLALAVNAPGSADSIVLNFVRSTKHKEWSDAWCHDLLKELATTKLLPNFAKRYNKARVEVERILGVKLPSDFHEEKETTVVVAKLTQVAPKLIQLEPQDIIVPIPKKGIMDRIAAVFKRK